MSVPKIRSPAPVAQPPERPTDVLRNVAGAFGKAVGAPMIAVEALTSGLAAATNIVAQALPAFPAATMGSMVMGAPHAHVAHPPSGPPPIPPTPLPPVGAILAGCSVQVLLNGQPAARCGDIILNPTCCGIPPLGEVKTGSSNVFIGGARAARVMDISMHCPIVSGGSASRAAAIAAKTAAKAMQGLMLAGMAAQGLSFAVDTVEAVEADNSAMLAALGMSAAMMSAQMAADAAAMALGAAMGKDVAVPPGTPGAVTTPGAANVMIGGFPMPSLMNMAMGLMKSGKGLRRRRKGKSAGIGKPG